MAPTTARVTPKDFFLWLGAVIALYWSIIAFIFLLFNYINFAFPDALAAASDPYQGGLPYEMASLVVLVPLYLVIVSFIRRSIANDPSRKEVWVRRWAIILTLFIAGFSIAVDIITLLTAFFRGSEITTAFLLKVVSVLVVAAVGFYYFIYDLRGYWDEHRSKTRIAALALIGVALISIIAGFFIVGTPYQARLMRYDTQRVSDLQNIQWQVVSYWQNKRALPKDLDALTDPLSNYSAPVDPETGAVYEYQSTAPLTFELCANFDRENETPGDSSYAYGPVAPAGVKGATDSWAHAAGHVCYTRTIDPELYPPAPKTAQ